jgi:hypothetical protein
VLFIVHSIRYVTAFGSLSAYTHLIAHIQVLVWLHALGAGASITDAGRSLLYMFLVIAHQQLSASTRVYQRLQGQVIYLRYHVVSQHFL